MKKHPRKERCLCCGKVFKLNPYNRHHQKYCGKEECRRKSHCASSKNYRDKKRDDAAYRKDEKDRVRKWRKRNPDLKKNQKNTSQDTVLRDFVRGENASQDEVLRDFVKFFVPCIKGFIWVTTGVLRDDIGSQLKHYYDKGKELSTEFEEQQFNLGVFANAAKGNHQSGAKTEASRGVRMGGSPSGARKFNQQI